jgi:3-dehydroquinate synthase
VIRYQECLLNIEYDFIIVDKNILKFYPEIKIASPLTIVCEEKLKNMDSVMEILRNLQQKNVKKSSLIGVVGGGIIQDLSTLALSIYMRGLRWHFYPTTLQAMIDSCIGGKSSINFGHQKNLIGNYYPPEKIFIDINFLKTIHKIEIVSGLIEGVKIVSTKGNAELENYGLKVGKALGEFDNNLEVDSFIEIIKEALEIKRDIIEMDEFDEGKRKILNFGHTFGHVFESISDLKINHGLAVGLGILSAIEFSNSINNQINSELENTLRQIILGLISPYKEQFNLDLDLDKVQEFIIGDKKNDMKNLTFILAENDNLEIFKLLNNSKTLHAALKAMNLALKSVKNA